MTEIEANNSEINVDELMNKIREQVAQRQNFTSSERSNFHNINLSSAVENSHINYIDEFLVVAEYRASVRTKLPDKYNRFPLKLSKKLQKLVLKVLEIIVRDQREANFHLMQALRKFLLLIRQLIEQIAAIQAQVSAIDTRLQAMDERVSATDNRLQAMDERVSATDNRLQAMDERVSTTDNRLQVMDERVSTTDNRLQAMDERVSATDNRLQAMDERVSTTDNRLQVMDERVSATDNRFQVMDERVGATDNRLQVMDERVGATDNRLQVMDERVGATDNRLQVMDERVGATDTRLQVMEERVSAMDERHIKNDSYLKNDLAQQKRLITLFLEEARRRLPEPFNQDQLLTLVNEDRHLLDAFYVAFEDQFRGSYKDIIDRLKVYLPLIAEAKIGKQDSPILDVGCGRGEWLELLRKTGYIAQGIDINRVMIDQCRARGLQVLEGDVISYLQFLPDASLGAVTGFHIIEHLPFEVLNKLFDETVRVLKSGGLIIFETPNPRNILVGSGDFYRDPTHINPLHPDTIGFVAQSKGLARNNLYFFEYIDSCLTLLKSSEKRFDNLNDYVNISRDYVLVAYKP